MVEVFKTNVTSEHGAVVVVKAIENTFRGYSANFDLEDCDRILRVKNIHGLVDSAAVLNIVDHCGFQSEILEDEIPARMQF